MPPWLPHPRLDETLVPVIQKVIDRTPPEHLIEPSSGEQFDVPDEAYTRLQNYAFSQGFAVVVGSCGKGRKAYECVHHKSETQNNRKLDDHIGEGSNRKVEATKLKSKGCDWRCSLAYKAPNRHTENMTWVLGVKEEARRHSHPMAPNPLSYDIHARRQPDYAKAMEMAKTHRVSKLTYRESDRVLDNTPKEEGEIYHISKNKYYKLIPSTTRSRDDIITGLLQCLDSTEFTARVRCSYILDDAGVPVKKLLEQIFFIDKLQRDLTKRFCSNFMLQMDATFNTNALKMLLFVAVGITNTNLTFPAAFSFAISESEVVVNFFLQCLKEEVFDDCPVPRVIVVDQGKGIQASLSVMMPTTYIQLCQWHAAENVRAKVAKSKGYDWETRKAIHDLTWAYFQAATHTALNENRTALMRALKPSERAYMKDNWFPKEPQVISCYTRRERNAGAESTQRNEGMHPVIKAVTNPQTSLETAINSMQSELKRLYRSLREVEERSRIDGPRAVDLEAFHLLIGHVSIWAMEKINPEWIAAKELATLDIEEGPCHCDIYIQWALPCRHYLLRACREGFPIPMALLHPRWWLDGPLRVSPNWMPRYYDQTLDPDDSYPERYSNQNTNRFLTATANLQTLHQNLPRPQADLLVKQLTEFQTNVTMTHDHIQKQTLGLPVELSKPPPTSKKA